MNADDFETLTYQMDSVQGKNLYQYCFNNPINMQDEDGGWPKWVTQVLVGTAVIAAAAVLTVATAGTGTALAAVAVGALKGSVIGAIGGAAVGATSGASSCARAGSESGCPSKSKTPSSSCRMADTDNMMSAPKGLTSASGIDVMTHAIEAYVSMMASDYTDGLALRAIKLVFDYLPRAYRDGNDVEARDHMANASCMAGMAFANAFLGVNHSLAHKLGAFHHIPHGIANALVLTDVMRYNADEVPTKMGTFPQYQYPKTLARYAEIGRFVGLTGKDDKEVFEKLLDKLEELKKIIEIKPTIKDYGVDEKYFLETLDEMSEQAFNDQCTGANPRYPLIAELKEIYLKAYYGK